MADFTFYDLLLRRNFDRKGCRLVRHDRRGLAEWQSSTKRFDHFVSFQSNNSRSPYRNASWACQFVPYGGSQALFVRAHKILRSWIFGRSSDLPLLYDQDNPYAEDEGLLAYDLAVLEEFADIEGRIVIDWGSGARSWSQWLDKARPKPILEIKASLDEPAFPGFANFRSDTDAILTLPQAWKSALQSVRGVYLLVCMETGEQYVGSAYGEDGFWGRWLAYAKDGHGGNVRLKARKRMLYQIAILEIASSDQAPNDIIRREGLWKDKLGSRAFGLNQN